MAGETVKVDWQVNDICYINGVRHRIITILRRINGLPDCIVESAAYFEDMKESPND